MTNNKNNTKNIWISCADNDLPTVRTYLSQGHSANSADPNGYTPIHAASSYNHQELLRLLMEHDGNVNIQDAEGDTPLHHVEEVEMAKLLVETYHADYKIKNNDGLTAMEYIDEDDEFPEVVQYLKSLIHGGGVNDDDVDEDTPQLPEGQTLRYSYENPEDITLNIDDEQRLQLKEIVEGDNAEEKLAQFLKSQVEQQIHSESPASKKRKD